MNILHITTLTCVLTCGFPLALAQAQDKAVPVPETVLQPVKLSELEIESAVQGWGELGKNVSVEGRKLTVGDRIFEHGLGTHAASEIIYMLNGRFEKFESWIGLDQEVRIHAWSPDGLRWSKARNIEVPKDMPKWWDGGTLTPLGCVAESDGTYTIFFMAHHKNVNWQELGFVRVKVQR